MREIVTIKNVELSSDILLNSKKLYLQKSLKKAENRLKKYIKEDNKSWIMMEQRRVWDLEEQLKQLL